MERLRNEVVDSMFSEFESLLRKFKNIELDLETTKEYFKNDLGSLPHPITDIDLWILKIKNSIEFSITVEFAESFLKNELLLEHLSKKEIEALKDYSDINTFNTWNDDFSIKFSLFEGVKIISILVQDIINESRKDKLLRFVLENSLSEDIQKYKLINFFGGEQRQQLSSVEKFLVTRANEALKEEFEKLKEEVNNMDDLLINYIKNFQ